jgi:hypothetical protein
MRTPLVWVCILVGLTTVAMAPVVGNGQTQSPARDSQLSAAVNPAPVLKPEAPDQAEQAIGQPEVAVAALAPVKPVKPIVLEAATLLKLATDLKAELDKTRKDELSVAVVRKAAQIEHLAHEVRTK